MSNEYGFEIPLVSEEECKLQERIEELERIKSAYNSGLKVQIWSCGNWINFDAREYPYGGFSTKRQYRIVGDEYAEKAETEINRLKTENNKLQRACRKWFNQARENKKEVLSLKKENHLLGERCNQLLKDKGDLTDKIDDIKANCDLAIEGRDIKIKELEQENNKLLDVINNQDVKIADLESNFRICEKNADTYYDNLTKAKEIIKKFSEFANNEIEYNPEYPQEHTDLWNELCEQAEQFLKGENIILEDAESGNSPFDADEVFNKEMKAYPEEK